MLKTGWFVIVMIHSWSVEIASFARVHMGSNIAHLNPPHLHLAFQLRWPVGISPRSLASKSWSPCAIVRSCLRDSTFSRFGTMPACDRQTYRQADGRTDTRRQHTALTLRRAVKTDAWQITWQERWQIQRYLDKPCKRFILGSKDQRSRSRVTKTLPA